MPLRYMKHRQVLDDHASWLAGVLRLIEPYRIYACRGTGHFPMRSKKSHLWTARPSLPFVWKEWGGRVLLIPRTVTRHAESGGESLMMITRLGD